MNVSENQPPDSDDSTVGDSIEPPGASKGLDTDRSLLFGLLALQVNFIDQKALITAIRAWIEARPKPMRAILAERAGLTEPRLALLDGLVQEYLAEHGDDLSSSLLSLGTARPDPGQIDDPDVRESLSQLDTTRSMSSTVDDDATDDVARNSSFTSGGQRGGTSRYRIVAFHAEGGLGCVFRAHDEELHREVALKEIRPTYADNAEIRARFVSEAEITGRLQHPGIAPVYGMGHYSDGRPYYAMKFIHKGSLKEAITAFHGGKDSLPWHSGERAVAFRKLLGQFLLTCDVIAYAHSRGVLHRDLKPANILIGDFGETIVVDWGLAKPVGRPEEADDSDEETIRPSGGSGSGLSVVGSVIGTVEYMSPEQAMGRSDIGPASDLYGLGATLYCLLAGNAPIQGLRKLEKAKAGDFRRPRGGNPHVPPALEAICLKAMAFHPEDRYPKPSDLADDLNRWLADEPVSVYRDPLLKRSSRWVRRHKPLVAAAAVLVVVGVVGLIIDDFRVSREKAKTERNYAQARRAVDTIYQQVASHLALTPGFEDYRLKLADDFLLEYDALLLARPSDVELRADAVAAYREAANLGRLMGKVDKPLDRYRRALELINGLISEFPAKVDYRLLRAYTNVDLGEFWRMSGRFAEAEKEYQNALETAVSLRAERPDDDRLRRVKAMALLDLAVAQNELGRNHEALRSSQESLDHCRFLVKCKEPHKNDPNLLISALMTHGTARRDSGDASGAEGLFEEAIVLATRGGTADPNYASALASALADQAKCFESDPKRLAQVRKNFIAASGLFGTLARQSPSIGDHVRDLSDAFNGLGGVALALGDLALAVRYCEGALKNVDARLKDRDLPHHHSLKGRILANLGRIALAQKKPAEARKLLGEAIVEHEHVLAALPDRNVDRKAVEALKAEREKVPAG